MKPTKSEDELKRSTVQVSLRIDIDETWAELKSQARDLVLELYPEFQDVAQRRRAI